MNTLSLSTKYNLIGFSINNFRVFGNKAHFDLAPITVLTGTNSSGKSSFTKALKLLTESYKTNGLRELELMESDLKLGDFDAVKNIYGKSEVIKFGLLIQERIVNPFDEGDKYFIELMYNRTVLCGIKVEKNGIPVFVQESTNIKYGVTLPEKSYIRLPVSVVNTEKLRGLFPGVSEKSLEILNDSILEYLQSDLKAHTFNNAILFYQRADILNHLYEDVLAGLSHTGDVIYHEYYQEDEVLSSNPAFHEVLPSDFLDLIPFEIQNKPLAQYLDLRVLKNLEVFPLDILHNIFNRLEFIEGVRATQEIIYTKSNSPGFYNALSKVYSQGQVHLFKNRDFKHQVVDVFKLFEPDDEIELKRITGYGFKFEIKKRGVDIGLAGYGYGVAQLLPILIKVQLNPNAIFVIEEPEGNLHPALQSKLADFFSTFSRTGGIYKANFIIETHSEYLIRKFQFLVANKKSNLSLAHSDVIIYYFYHPNEIPPMEDQIKKIEILGNGTLSHDFGTGFFDESDKIAMSIWSMTYSQNN